MMRQDCQARRWHPRLTAYFITSALRLARPPDVLLDDGVPLVQEIRQLVLVLRQALLEGNPVPVELVRVLGPSSLAPIVVPPLGIRRGVGVGEVVCPPDAWFFNCLRLLVICVLIPYVSTHSM